MYTHFKIKFDKHLSALFNFYIVVYLYLSMPVCLHLCVEERYQHTDTLLTGILPEI